MSERFSGMPMPDPEKIIPKGISADESAELLDRRPLRMELIEEFGPSGPVTAYHQDTFRLLQSKERVEQFYIQEAQELGQLVVALEEAHDDLEALSGPDKELVKKYGISTRDQALVAEMASEQRLASAIAGTDQFKEKNAKSLASRYEVVKRFGPPEEMIPDDATQARAFANTYAVPEPAKPLEAADYVPHERREHADLFKRYHDSTVQLERIEKEEENFRSELSTLSLMRRSDWERIAHVRGLLHNIKKAKKIINQGLDNLRKEMREKGIDSPEE